MTAALERVRIDVLDDARARVGEGHGQGRLGQAIDGPHDPSGQSTAGKYRLERLDRTHVHRFCAIQHRAQGIERHVGDVVGGDRTHRVREREARRERDGGTEGADRPQPRRPDPVRTTVAAAGAPAGG